MLHKIEGILVCHRHKIQVLLTAQLVALVKNAIAGIAIAVEIFPDNGGVSLPETFQYFLI